ncbi:MAG: hypothetical protein ACRD3Q_20230, partial [Terriglobales bacterium]
VVDREMQELLERITSALTGDHPRELLEQAALALLSYIESNSDGFRILLRDSPIPSTNGHFSSLISDIATKVEHILAGEFKSRGLDPKLAGLYSQSLVGMVAFSGQWWLEVQKPKKQEVAAHLINLAWNGLSGLKTKPNLRIEQKKVA